MNKLKIFRSFSVCVTLVILFLGSCASEEFISHTNNLQHIPTSGTEIRANDQQELNKMANLLANEVDNITIIKNAEIVDLTDNQGDFRALSFKYQTVERMVSMIVPLSETAGIEVSGLRISEESCVMKFYGKQECKYQIVERCKLLEILGAGNSTSVAFLDLPANQGGINSPR
ncbi:MAG TPA: hypothetical protein PK325_12260 [Cyclobacteriaceae bacterium]|nr:hypothetical protein [Cyclobacteriaceae bacterium]HMV08758.1 hypothetical protein [Cyclobacteriaceae bacterium]HMV90216.1 hypothetical protein [Cyclobacteriaceae bacterium]HMW99903.1 hypothetical protein [Cyclobacteriaceae bacterium]HMX49234.1 hypothetical protein [Cyclobacteriaceae bacterium]